MSDALPLGTWINCRGVRRFIAADPFWRPDDPLEDSLYIFRELMVAPGGVDVPEWPPRRHICHCGCLLFGIENCPNCEWLAMSQERTA